MPRHLYSIGAAFGVSLTITMFAAGIAVGQSADRVDTRRDASQQTPTIPQGHPLVPALSMAHKSLEVVNGIEDYSCVFVKRERIDGELSEYEHMYIKVRHEPFSVYLYCLGPQKPRGQEVIYVHGRNNNQVLAHTVGLRDRIAGTLTLDPTHPRMMEGNLYPITNIGMQNLLIKISGLYERETRFGECHVDVLKSAKVEQRPCTCVQVVHPVPRRDFKFYVSRVFYDDQWQVPVRFEGHTWPAKAGGDPVLIEEYTYTRLRFNQQFADSDFSAANSKYSFQ